MKLDGILQEIEVCHANVASLALKQSPHSCQMPHKEDCIKTSDTETSHDQAMILSGLNAIIESDKLGSIYLHAIYKRSIKMACYYNLYW